MVLSVEEALACDRLTDDEQRGQRDDRGEDVSAPTCGWTARSTLATVFVVVWNAIASPGTIASTARRNAANRGSPPRSRASMPK